MATGTRGKPFEPGNNFGKGRPPGSRNKKSKLLEAIEAQAPNLINQCMLKALQGDMTAMRLCMERLVAVAKTPGMRFHIGKLETLEDWMKVLPSILKQASKGQGSALEVEAYARVVESHFRSVAVCDIEKRLRALEEEKKSEEEPKEPAGLVWLDEDSDEPESTGTAAEETGTEEGAETETKAGSNRDSLERQIRINAPPSRNDVGDRSSNSDGAQRSGSGSIKTDLDKSDPIDISDASDDG